jgi:hypothetical protein
MMNLIKMIVLVILTLGIVFGMLMFLGWIRLIEFLPWNSLVGLFGVAIIGIILTWLDKTHSIN